MRLLTACLSLLVALPASAQSPIDPAPDELAALSDEFDGAALTGWTRFDQAMGWPDKIRAIDVGETTPGTLHIEPYHSAWVRDLTARCGAISTCGPGFGCAGAKAKSRAAPGRWAG